MTRQSLIMARATSFALAAVATMACSPETPPAGPGVSGRLLDEQDRPLAYQIVMACTAAICFYGDTGGDGRFTFLLDAPGPVLIKTHESLSTNPRRTSPMVPITVEDAVIDVGAVYTPSLPSGATVGVDSLGPVTVDAGDGVILELDPGQVTLAAGGRLTDVAARRLPDRMIPPYPALPANEQLLAVYALHPFGATSSRPVPVRVALTLAAGTPVIFRTISDLDGRFSEPIPGTATGDWLTTDADRGIASLTHLVVTSRR